MSNQVKPNGGNQRDGATGGHKGRPPARVARRNAQRAAAQHAAAEAAAARRRRMAIIGAAAGVLAVVVIVVLVVTLGGSNKTSTASQPSASASSSASAGASATASPTAAFPPVPAGADAALKTKPKVTAGTGTLTKLTTTTLIAGKGAAVTSGQTITVNYVGVSFKTGKEFDSSWSRSQAFSFPLGQGQVIKGWDQGLVGVKMGSRVQLDIPSNLAYGDTSTNGSPTGPLRFVVDVLSAQ